MKFYELVKLLSTMSNQNAEIIVKTKGYTYDIINMVYDFKHNKLKLMLNQAKTNVYDTNEVNSSGYTNIFDNMKVL